MNTHRERILLKNTKSQTTVIVSILVVIIIYLFMIADSAFSSYFEHSDSLTYIDGVYSADHSAWTKTKDEHMMSVRFHNAVIKGTLDRSVTEDRQLIIFADHIWFTLEADNETIATNYRSVDHSPLKKTPGCSIIYVDGEKIDSAKELTLTLNFPYPLFSDKKLDEFFEMHIGTHATPYEILFEDYALTILYCFVLCFLGLFVFPIAGIVLGGIDYKYLAFAFLCFSSGVFVLTEWVYQFIPLWIPKPIHCMSLCELTNHIFMISALAFINVIMKNRTNKIIGSIIIGVFSAATVLTVIFSFTGVYDLYASNAFVQSFFILCMIFLTIMFSREFKTNRTAVSVIISWIPLSLSLVFDLANEFSGFVRFWIFPIGLAVTLGAQILQLLFDLKKQYNETIRYQQMQKELYEAKVSLMVSQIQPHFLYNSLTSIAMMCTKDPQTAKTATINFADYLRGNMNSLKERAPVPFERELEHLKKYLMLEQLRFGDMLNIEYDIQATDFKLPLLTVQPLVENAVKHGVGMKEDGGTVRISTRETESSFEVIITDDGVGFDTTQPPKDDGRTHVGMENVRQRLRDLCSAEVIIESEPGKGTTAKIIIPKERET